MASLTFFRMPPAAVPEAFDAEVLPAVLLPEAGAAVGRAVLFGRDRTEPEDTLSLFSEILNWGNQFFRVVPTPPIFREPRRNITVVSTMTTSKAQK